MQYFGKALLFTSGKSLHTLFAASLIYEEIIHINAILDIFATPFCDNIPYQFQNWLNILINLINMHDDYGLYLLGELLKESKKTHKQ